MVIHIDDPVVESQINKLAEERGESVMAVIVTAVAVLGERDRPRLRTRPTVEDIQRMIQSFPAVPISYDLTEDEILGYGANGYSE